MSLSVRSRPYIIPEYSLTGDLLAYLTCGLQYRYYNKGSLPPSTPVQLWFGEFIHSLMEESYLRWLHESESQRFPWDWTTEIREIELQIDQRLTARGLYPPPNVFCPYTSSTVQGLCPDANHPHQLIASQRSEAAINTWGQHLFPLVAEPEVRLKGSRQMPGYQAGFSRSNYYGITGVIDVVSSVNLDRAPRGNLILHHIHENDEVHELIDSLPSQEYEVIIDYKGMTRPPEDEDTWQYHEWQILTYAWLRSQQAEASTVVAGLIFYLNELALSQENMVALQDAVSTNSTDIMPQGPDLQAIRGWTRGSPVPPLSTPLKERRSIRMIPVTSTRMQESLQEFDDVVSQIEGCVLSEMAGNRIAAAWQPNPVERTCTACDFKIFCSRPAPGRYHPTVP